jgi:hypothetical protein
MIADSNCKFKKESFSQYCVISIFRAEELAERRRQRKACTEKSSDQCIVDMEITSHSFQMFAHFQWTTGSYISEPPL